MNYLQPVRSQFSMYLHNFAHTIREAFNKWSTKWLYRKGTDASIGERDKCAHICAESEINYNSSCLTTASTSMSDFEAHQPFTSFINFAFSWKSVDIRHRLSCNCCSLFSLFSFSFTETFDSIELVSFCNANWRGIRFKRNRINSNELIWIWANTKICNYFNSIIKRANEHKQNGKDCHSKDIPNRGRVEKKINYEWNVLNYKRKNVGINIIFIIVLFFFTV